MPEDDALAGGVESRLQPFLRGLLGMEAEIFIKAAKGQGRASQCQVVMSAGQPLLG
jgi:hypothetical protein